MDQNFKTRYQITIFFGNTSLKAFHSQKKKSLKALGMYGSKF